MQKVAIVTDSIACLTPEMVRQYRLRIVPINIHFEDEIYRNGVDISSAGAYELLGKAPQQFASSPASAGEYLEAYRELSSQFESILCITLSSKLSTLHNMAEVARKQAKEELPQTTIELVDSQTAAGAEGLIVLAAARAAAEGANLGEVIRVAEEVRGKTSLIGILETIRHVYRTGRIPKVASQVGSILSLKPLVTISEGVVHFAGLARTKQHGVNRIVDIMRQKVSNRPVRASIMHADVPEEAERLKERISSEFNCVELWLTYFSPIMGYATGRGTLVTAFYPEG